MGGAWLRTHKSDFVERRRCSPCPFRKLAGRLACSVASSTSRETIGRWCWAGWSRLYARVVLIPFWRSTVNKGAPRAPPHGFYGGLLIPTRRLSGANHEKLVT